MFWSFDTFRYNYKIKIITYIKSLYHETKISLVLDQEKLSAQ